jgi:hypothetical protein
VSDLDQPGAPGSNTGHGHVYPRPDGARARCGGPALCGKCAADLARKSGAQQGSDSDPAGIAGHRTRLHRLVDGERDDLWNAGCARCAVSVSGTEWEARMWQLGHDAALRAHARGAPLASEW